LPQSHSFRDICRTNRVSRKAVAWLRGAGFRQALFVEDGMLG